MKKIESQRLRNLLKATSLNLVSDRIKTWTLIFDPKPLNLVLTVATSPVLHIFPWLNLIRQLDIAQVKMYVITQRNLPLSVSMSLSLWVYVCLSLCVYNLVHLSLCKQTYFSQNWNHAIYLVLYLPLNIYFKHFPHAIKHSVCLLMDKLSLPEKCRKRTWKGIVIVVQSLSCVWLFATMNYSLPGSSVPHCLPEFAQIHVHWVSYAILPSHPLPPSFPFAFSLSQHQSLFQCVGIRVKMKRR